jgi:hypothetical protein
LDQRLSKRRKYGIVVAELSPTGAGQQVAPGKAILPRLRKKQPSVKGLIGYNLDGCHRPVNSPFVAIAPTFAA